VVGLADAVGVLVPLALLLGFGVVVAGCCFIFE